MHCRNCGLEIDNKASVCIHCGVMVGKGDSYCQSCGQSTLPNDQYCMQCGTTLAAKGKDWLTTLILNIFVGYLGVHRFYTGNIGIGVIQLLTAGGCGIWVIIDLILIITGDYKDGNGKPLDRSNY